VEEIVERRLQQAKTAEKTGSYEGQEARAKHEVGRRRRRQVHSRLERQERALVVGQPEQERPRGIGRRSGHMLAAKGRLSEEEKASLLSVKTRKKTIQKTQTTSQLIK